MKNLKTVLPYFITLVVGFGLGFLTPLVMENTGDGFTIAKDYKVSHANHPNNLTRASFTLLKKDFLGSLQIDSARADSMVRIYRKQNDKAWFRRLRTDSGESLHGFWIPRVILDTILHQTGVNGLRIYLGKRPEIKSSRRIFSLVLLGTQGQETNLYGVDQNKDMVSAGSLIYDHVDPCPQACGTLGGN